MVVCRQLPAIKSIETETKIDMRVIKRLVMYLLLVFVLFNIYWQFCYEQSIKRVCERCDNVKKRKRLKYTPILVYKLSEMIGNPKLHKDRLLALVLVADCPITYEVTGYELEYMCHVYLSEHEKDSLLLVHKTDVDRSLRWRKRMH